MLNELFFDYRGIPKRLRYKWLLQCSRQLLTPDHGWRSSTLCIPHRSKICHHSFLRNTCTAIIVDVEDSGVFFCSRPRKVADVSQQAEAKRLLSRIIETGNVRHSYLHTNAFCLFFPTFPEIFKGTFFPLYIKLHFDRVCATVHSDASSAVFRSTWIREDVGGVGACKGAFRVFDRGVSMFHALCKQHRGEAVT